MGNVIPHYDHTELGRRWLSTPYGDASSLRKIEVFKIWDDLKPSDEHDFAQEPTVDMEGQHPNRKAI